MSPAQGLLGTLLGACCCIAALPATEEPDPLPTLPPHPRPLHLDDAAARDTSDREEVDAAGLTADLEALRQDVRAIRRALEQALREGRTPGDVVDLGGQLTADEGADTDEGEPRYRETRSNRLGQNLLILRQPIGDDDDSGALVTARIHAERARLVYDQLAFLLDREVDDDQLEGEPRRVSLYCTDLPWREALKRVLGQVGLEFEIVATTAKGKIQIYSSAYKPPGARIWLRRARESLRQAAAGGRDEIAAEASYLLARYDQQRRRYWDAISSYAALIERYRRVEDEAVRIWVRRSLLAIGESCLALELYEEAFGRYRRYIARARDDDPYLPEAYLQAARAARQLYRRDEDDGYLLRSTELLQLMISTFGASDESRIVYAVSRARVMLAELLFDQGAFAESKRLLQEYVRDRNGEELNHLLLYRLAECDYQLGLAARRERQYRLAESLLINAYDRYLELGTALEKGRRDSLVPLDVYRRAMYRLGQIVLQQHGPEQRPNYVKALFHFLRAKQRFEDTGLEGEVLVNLARCYAAIGVDKKLKANLWKELSDNEETADRSADVQVQELLADLLGGIDAYPGRIEHKVRFFIAQANAGEARGLVGEEHAALRDELYRKAIHQYERVIRPEDGAPTPTLAMASKLGLARAAFGMGDDQLAVQTLKEVLRSPDSHPRDLAFAASLLGDHYRARGDLERAIEAYRAGSGETVDDAGDRGDGDDGGEEGVE